MQQDGNCFCCSHLRGRPHPRWDPPATPLYLPTTTTTISASYITHPSHSHTWIKGCVCVYVEHGVHLDAIVHLCNEIQQSPLLPLSLRRTLRLIWTVSVSSQHGRLLGTDAAVCFLSLRCSLTCPHCLKQSNTFDPFLCISLPIPLRQTRWVLLANYSCLYSHQKYSL